jgi:uncharacterized protein (DUF1697 family)
MSPSMKRYTALLRAINVGGRVVKMDRLRALFEELGFARVTSFIASGNVSFETESGDEAALTARIEDQLLSSLGYEVATFVRTPDELAAIAAFVPFADAADGDSLYVALLRAPPVAAGRRRLLEHRSDIDDLVVHGREVYWRCRVRSSDSNFSGAKLEQAISAPATLRNITTMRKLAALQATP